ncbi:MAG TPA: tRNA epoxyqueuosine(34) reductase QueG [Terracidiphilus sp.]
MNPSLPSAAHSEPLIHTDGIRALAVNSGFSHAGVVALPHAHDARDAERFADWINSGRAGTMEYLKRANEDGELVRARVATPFKWARSAIVCLANYNSDQPKSTDAACSDAAWIARYAWSSRTDPQRGRVPSDYHKVLLKRLKVLETKLHEQYGSFESRAYVDTGPVVERSLAVAAGVGWSAKNACLIHPAIGSYAFLSVLITSLSVAPEHSALTVPDRCGSCTRCIQACPTDALFAPYQMDATRCISYLTIEHKGAIAPELMEGMGRQVFGCDICQDVCPWNRKAPISADPELAPREELVNSSLDWLSSLDERSFEQAFNGSPVRRAQYAGLIRNTAIAMGNAHAATAEQKQRYIRPLRAWAHSSDDGIRSAATWALNRLEDPGNTADNR